jgi:divalent metal cation (Fe/Co/Zn/Cd) transporter
MEALRCENPGARLEREQAVGRGVRLEWFTIGYNALEGVIALVAGWMAGSIALIGFGFDSAIEVTSGAAVLWRLRGDEGAQGPERRETAALRIVGVTFLMLAGYVSYEAAGSLLVGEPAEHSLAGILLAVASLIVMPILARAKRRVAGQIGSTALTADATQTEFCTYLSAILLAGLGLNALFGWWWADPVAALAMVPIIGREAVEALRGRTCCAACP